MSEYQAQVPYFVHEGSMVRMERIIRMLAAFPTTLLLALFIVWSRRGKRRK